MRTRMWMAAGACAVALAGTVALAGPASAKGIQSATISGPGLDHPIDVTPPNGDGGRLSSVTGFWDVMPGQPRPPTFTDEAPPGQLGPRYTITWRLMTGPNETTAIRQEIYPYAEAGPLVHTGSGQPVFDATTDGGWYAAPFLLRDALQELGVPVAGAASAEPPPANTTAARAPSSDDDPSLAVMLGAAAGLAAAGVGVGFAIRARRARRRERVAPVPL